MQGGHFEGKKFEKKTEKKCLAVPKKIERGDSLVSPGMVCYAEKQVKPFWSSSLGQMVQFDTIIFCRTFKNYFGQFVWIEKKRVTIIVAFHFMKRRLKTWGQSARDSLNNTLAEFDDLFVKHKADIGCCTKAKHPVELEPGATLHCEGARRMSPDKAERANQEVRNLLALGMIEPSLSPRATGIVMVKKKNGELRFCCDFCPLNVVTILDAYPLLRIDESLSRLGKAKIYNSTDLAWAFWQIPARLADRQKTAFACELGLFERSRTPFGMRNASATLQRAKARALEKIVTRKKLWTTWYAYAKYFKVCAELASK